jgi:hypothetical protein
MGRDGSSYRAVSGRALTAVWQGVPRPPAMVGGGYEKVDGVNHDLSLLGSRDVGGPVAITRDIFDVVPGKFLRFQAAGSDCYVHPTAGIGSGLPEYSVPSKGSILGYGTTAIAQTTPTSPLFSAATFLGEIRNDGLPSPSGVTLWRERAKSFKALGSEYLNVEFGWRPFVNDLQSFAHSVKKASGHVQEFTSKTSRRIRVGHRSGGSFNHQQLKTDLFVFIGDTSGAWERPPGTLVIESGTEQWFKGAYTYYSPSTGPFENVVNFERQANHLLGTRLTPEVVWNLAPWSWALDWYGNMGDVMHNLSTIGHDGLVLEWGYVMSHSKVEYNASTPFYDGGFAPSACTSRWVRETKLRFPASPYFGFGAIGSLSDRQSAILAALGMSRGRR